MAQGRKTIFITRCDYPEEAILSLKEKFVVKCYPYPNDIPQECLLSDVKWADAIFCSSLDNINKDVIEAAGPQLKVIATMSIGYDHIDIGECRKRNIVVCNAQNPLSVGAVAEMAIGLLLAVGRRIIESSTIIERGEWVESWTPTFCLGRGLMNTVVGIVGMGRIGNAILKRLKPFDVEEVVYSDVYHPVAHAEELGTKYLPFEELLQRSDYVIASVNLTPESKFLFDARAFSLMKPTAVFVNISRGMVVNLDDLYKALKCRQIKGAALDVMYPEPLPKDHKLVSLPNIVLLPHIASAEETAVKRLGDLTAQNILQVLEGKPALTPVL